MKKLTKSIVVPIDGSPNSLKSIDYIGLIYGNKYDLKITCLYILPSLPPILTDEKTMDRKIRKKLAVIKEKNLLMAEQILQDAKNLFISKGFKEENIKTVHQKQAISIAKDIYNHAASKQADNILLTRRGRSDCKIFSMGEISNRLIGYCRRLPIWIIGGVVRSKKVLICMDSSENALRAVDHAGFMLSGTDCKITLFHSMKCLKQFIPIAMLDGDSDLEELWKYKAGQTVASYLKEAEEMLLRAGLAKNQITKKVMQGGKSPANDILKEAQNNDYGTIVLGRRGISGIKELLMGSVTTNIIHSGGCFAVWII